MYKGNLYMYDKTRIQVFIFNFIWKLNARIVVVYKKSCKKAKKTINRH